MSGLWVATVLVTAFTVRRAPHPRMGGFEQQSFSAGGSRVSVLVSGSSSVAESLPDAWRKSAAEGQSSGVIYVLSSDKIEIVAEGEEKQLKSLVSLAQLAADEGGATCREAWQLPVGGYDPRYPSVELTPVMEAKVTITGKSGTLDYYKRNLQVEAVFNRGLELSSRRPKPDTLVVVIRGDSSRIKSFVRWCYAGPPLVKADTVSVAWVPVKKA